MICYQCKTDNTPSDAAQPQPRYCKQCGTDLWQAPAVKAQTAGLSNDLLYVLIVLGWDYFTYLVWIVVPKLITRSFTGTSSYGQGLRSISGIFSAMRWGLGSISVLLMILFAVLCKNNTVRVCLIIFAMVRLLALVVYQFS